MITVPLGWTVLNCEDVLLRWWCPAAKGTRTIECQPIIIVIVIWFIVVLVLMMIMIMKWMKAQTKYTRSQAGQWHQWLLPSKMHWKPPLCNWLQNQATNNILAIKISFFSSTGWRVATFLWHLLRRCCRHALQFTAMWLSLRKLPFVIFNFCLQYLSCAVALSCTLLHWVPVLTALSSFSVSD